MQHFRDSLGLSLASSIVLAVQLGACNMEPAPHDVAVLGESATVATDGKQLALGKAHGCSLDAAISGISCWGDNRRGQTDVPLLAAPSFVAAGGDTSCAIDNGAVRCWGDDSRGQRRVPLGLLGATHVTVGDAHVCALDARGGIDCWGDDTYGQLRAPSLSGVDALAAGARHTCALAAGVVTCWGDNAQHQLDVPALYQPSQLAVAANHSCVIDGEAVRCWGGGPSELFERAPTVAQPRLLATGASHACVLAASGVVCWGDSVAGDLTPRELTIPVQLAVGGGDGWAHACARHLQGVACWGSDNFGQVSYDGGPLHVLHRSESRIDAPPSRVWDALMDLDSYPQWNPYTVEMRSTLKVGDPMVMRVKMSDVLTIDQTEHIRVLEPGHKVCWGIETPTPEFNSGERCQWLEELPGGGTHYITEDLIEGTANPLVSALFGEAVENGFDAVALALKNYVE